MERKIKQANICLILDASIGAQWVGIPGGSTVKNPRASAGDVDPIPGWEGPPEEGNGSPLRYSCLGNPTEEPGGLQSTGSQKSQTRLSD